MIKICTQCKEEKNSEEDFYLIRGKPRAECKACNSKRTVKWGQANRDRRNASAKKWRESHPEELKQVVKRNCFKRKKICIEHYGIDSGCVCCSEKEICFLTLDHIQDDASEKKKTTGERLRYWMVIRDGFPEGLQTLCFNCQWGKRINKGFCPHHPEIDLRKGPKYASENVVRRHRNGSESGVGLVKVGN